VPSGRSSIVPLVPPTPYQVPAMPPVLAGLAGWLFDAGRWLPVSWIRSDRLLWAWSWDGNGGRYRMIPDAVEVPSATLRRLRVPGLQAP
jgi:hypothetical protein